MIFDPAVAKELLKIVLKGREENPADHKDVRKWLVNWGKDWAVESVNQRCRTWINGGLVASKEQMLFASEVVEYMTILSRSLVGHNGKTKVSSCQ